MCMHLRVVHCILRRPNERARAPQVIAAAVFSIVPHFQAISMVSAARKRYNVQYPTLYAVKAENKDADAFNAVQRGHQVRKPFTA